MGFPINVANERLRIADDDARFNLGRARSSYTLMSNISIGRKALRVAQ